MNQKTKSVCQLNSDGFYVGMVVADESPMEPGVFLIPAGCIDVTPPGATDSDVSRWDAESKSWLVVDKKLIEIDLHKKMQTSIIGTAAIQFFLDASAKNHGYESLLAAISYADEPAVPAYQADGRKFRALRSVVWEWFFADEKLSEMALDELVKLMPAFEA